MPEEAILLGRGNGKRTLEVGTLDPGSTATIFFNIDPTKFDYNLAPQVFASIAEISGNYYDAEKGEEVPLKSDFLILIYTSPTDWTRWIDKEELSDLIAFVLSL